MDTKNITILCKVVDNYGDIGFVYRLARALSELDDTLRLRLVVSDLPSFAQLAPQIDATKPAQSAYGWEIFDWNAAEICTRAFTQNPPAIILECFQCGRPEWLDALLFAPTTAGADKNDTADSDVVQILNIDYLTAEDYAEDFHLLKSGTRSTRVKKTNFMPGFTAKTGGLILDNAFMQSRMRARRKLSTDSGRCPTDYTDEHSENCERADFSRANVSSDFTMVFFSYERDCAPVVRALKDFQERSGRKVRVVVAAGKSQSPFLQAWERAGKPFAVTPLSFLPQEKWDALLCESDWNFVRGEDSLSRACLAGAPFVWQAYPQEKGYHLVKLAALNEKLRPYLSAELFSAYNAFSRAYNTNAESATALTQLLLQADALRAGFSRFADDLVANGNLAAHLLAWLTAR